MAAAASDGFSLQWRAFRFALPRPLQTAHGCLAERCGWLLRLSTSDGVVGWGEAAPLVFGRAAPGALHRTAAALAGLPLQALLLLPVNDPEWGQRLVALVRPHSGADPEALLANLAACSQAWPPSERPQRWVVCGQLAPTADGKWQRQCWQQWLASLKARPMG